MSVLQNVCNYVFDLIVKETFREKPKKGEAVTEPIDTRKGYYSDDIANTFGVPLEEHRKQTLVSENNGYINVAMLTGNQKLVEEKQLTLPESNETSQHIPTLYYGETVQKCVAEETEAQHE